MANVTDEAFRRIIATYGKPQAMWTEFVSVEGLCSEGRERLLPDLWYSDSERPIVAQIFGDKPEQFERIAHELARMGFDGIDINMGCPDKGVEKSGGGAALIKNPKLAVELIRAATRGAGNIPVSVKTRLGYNKMEYNEWLPHLLEAEPAVLTVHLRTRKEMSKVPAHWELASEIVDLRNTYAPEVLLFGNGDIGTLEEAQEKVHESGMDGAMIGRGIFGNPWFFSGHTPTIEEKLKVMIEHTELFEKLYIDCDIANETAVIARYASARSHRNATRSRGGVPRDDNRLKNFDVMKKHYKAYVIGFDGAKELRMELMEAKDAAEVRCITERFLSSL